MKTTKQWSLELSCHGDTGNEILKCFFLERTILEVFLDNLVRYFLVLR